MRIPVVQNIWRSAARGMAALRSFSDGGVASEFGMIAPAFLVFMLGSAEIGIIYLAKAALETATESAARLILTGQAPNTGNATADASTFHTAVCNELSGLFSCSGIMVNLQPATSYSNINTSTPTLTFDVNGNVTNSWVYNPGAPGALMVLEVMYQWPVLGLPLGVSFGNLSNGNLLLMSVQVFKNESIYGS
jgi:Flp pilus assembly protein TadG